MNSRSTKPDPKPASLPPVPEPKKDGNDVKWYDTRLMIPSLIIAPLLFLLFYTLAMRHKPPEGFVFERAPVLSGIYKCCEAGGRYSASWVGNELVDCRTVGYYQFLGTNRNDCGLKAELNGRTVEVVLAYIPSSGDRSPLGVRITSQGQTYLDVNDQEIRERWISASTSGAVTLAFIFTMLLHGVHGMYLIYFRKPNPHQGDQ
jgi:hypothetical protein